MALNNGRLKGLTPDQFSDAQRGVYAALTGGERGKTANLAHEDGSLIGPFNALLYSPEIGNRLQHLGEALRFSNSLDRKLVEIATLCVGRTHKAQFEWWAHERLAKAAGLTQEQINAIKQDAGPNFETDTEALVYRASQEVLTTSHLSDSTYATLKNAVGEQGVMDLITLIGYYTIISYVLNIFDVPLPAGEELPFDK